MQNAIRTPNFVYKMTQHEDFYEILQNQTFSNLQPSLLNFGNAYELYELAAYEYEHNQQVYNSLNPEDLVKLRNLASEQQWIFNTPKDGHSVNAVAGQTLAGKMYAQLASVSHSPFKPYSSHMSPL